jgi:hypothetical protein
MTLERGVAHAIGLLEGSEPGRVWAAWPFRTGLRSGVLAATGVEPAMRCDAWAQTVERLAESWERRDRERAGPSFPMVPGVPMGALSVSSFRHRLTLAVDRNRRDGLRFAVYRVTFPVIPPWIESLSGELTQNLRDTDGVCRPSPGKLLILIAGRAHHNAQVWRRIAALWDVRWRSQGGSTPAPPLSVEDVDLREPREAATFLVTVSSWLAAA